MARKCQSKNPSQCKIHGMGGKEEQLNLALAKAMDQQDFSKAVELRKQIDSLIDTDTAKAMEEEKQSFFSKLTSRFKKEDSEPVPVGTGEPYKGLVKDCGKCASCNPSSDITKYKHLSGGVCENPVPRSSSDVAGEILARHYDFNSPLVSSEQLAKLTGNISSILDDSSKSGTENGASKAVEEVRDLLWDDYTDKKGNKDTSRGGFISAATTTDIFYALGRENELGWVEGEAPGYHHNVDYQMRSEELFGNMQKLLSESPSSFKHKYEAKQGQKK